MMVDMLSPPCFVFSFPFLYCLPRPFLVLPVLLINLHVAPYPSQSPSPPHTLPHSTTPTTITSHPHHTHPPLHFTPPPHPPTTSIHILPHLTSTTPLPTNSHPSPLTPPQLPNTQAPPPRGRLTHNTRPTRQIATRKKKEAREIVERPEVPLKHSPSLLPSPIP
ncbi:hypothetical protein Pmani_022367 [Petrolisthes manimaculis]|uniref:Uncharacterized protein n=1 Tax=Petrolisthes manimaculis TaxID=1843537 RepID=A0AAE1PE56_9EUCA|nr:hypothetical protein Pmani_022367 [Petrolisthes manimaculis]